MQLITVSQNNEEKINQVLHGDKKYLVTCVFALIESLFW